MKQLVEYIVSNLVNHPEDVIIEETKTSGEEELSNITIEVNPEDVGRVIGRSGKVINAIRQIVRIAAIQKGIRVRVDLKDDGQPKPSQEEPTMEDQPQVDEPVVETKEEVKEEVKADEPMVEAPTLEEKPEA